MSRFEQGAVLLAAAILLTVAQLLLKRGMANFGAPEFSVSGVARIVRHIAVTPSLLAGYLVGFCAGLLWLAALSSLDLSLASPALTGTYFLLLLLSTRIFLGEHVSSQRWIGAALIIAGIVVASVKS